MVRPGVAYVRLLQFTKGAAEQFRRALDTLRAAGPLRGIVLDLRENSGGLFSELDPIAGTVLPTGTLLARELSRQGPGQLVATGTPLAPQTPLVVLINGDTFSSGEILSLALRDARRATLIGEKTGGALGATMTVALPAGAIGVTVAEVDGPQYEQVDRIGVAPDRLVPLTVEDVSSATDNQLDAALNILGAGD
jgi:carboxyl-terminal processing protease